MKQKWKKPEKVSFLKSFFLLLCVISGAGAAWEQLEDGSPAQMSIVAGGRKIDFKGEFTGRGYSPEQAPDIPNVIGVLRKNTKKD